MQTGDGVIIRPLWTGQWHDLFDRWNYIRKVACTEYHVPVCFLVPGRVLKSRKLHAADRILSETRWSENIFAEWCAKKYWPKTFQTNGIVKKERIKENKELQRQKKQQQGKDILRKADGSFNSSTRLPFRFLAVFRIYVLAAVQSSAAYSAMLQKTQRAQTPAHVYIHTEAKTALQLDFLILLYTYIFLFWPVFTFFVYLLLYCIYIKWTINILYFFKRGMSSAWPLRSGRYNPGRKNPNIKLSYLSLYTFLDDTSARRTGLNRDAVWTLHRLLWHWNEI